MTEDSSTITAASIAPPKPRINPHEIRNADLVQRFLAATPSYLYSPPPIGPPNFFFSEMLRSLCQAKSDANRNLAAQMRRPRKRLWTPPARFDADTLAQSKDLSLEKPLELTTKQSAFDPPHSTKAAKMESDKCIPAPVDSTDPPKFSFASSNTESTNAEASGVSLPSSDLALPPIPPLWYPPLYPPYGIDPLHFFIDLRVSGQIYDRNKQKDGDASSSGQVAKIRHGHGSAFTVPPKRDKSPMALNLSATMPNKANALDFGNNNNNSNTNNNNSNFNNNHDIDEKTLLPRNTNYVLQNLPRIYTSLTTPNTDDRQSLHSDESDCKSNSDIDVKDNDISNQSDDVVIVDDKHCGINAKHTLFTG